MLNKRGLDFPCYLTLFLRASNNYRNRLSVGNNFQNAMVAVYKTDSRDAKKRKMENGKSGSTFLPLVLHESLLTLHILATISVSILSPNFPPPRIKTTKNEVSKKIKENKRFEISRNLYSGVGGSNTTV